MAHLKKWICPSTIKAYVGVELPLHPFLISALNAMSGQLHGPFALPSDNKNPVHIV